MKNLKEEIGRQSHIIEVIRANYKTEMAADNSANNPSEILASTYHVEYMLYEVLRDYANYLAIDYSDFLACIEEYRAKHKIKVGLFYTLYRFPRFESLQTFDSMDRFMDQAKENTYICLYCGKHTRSFSRCVEGQCEKMTGVDHRMKYGCYSRFITKDHFLKMPIVYRVFPIAKEPEKNIES